MFPYIDNSLRDYLEVELVTLGQLRGEFKVRLNFELSVCHNA